MPQQPAASPEVQKLVSLMLPRARLSLQNASVSGPVRWLLSRNLEYVVRVGVELGLGSISQQYLPLLLSLLPLVQQFFDTETADLYRSAVAALQVQRLQYLPEVTAALPRLPGSFPLGQIPRRAAGRGSDFLSRQFPPAHNDPDFTHPPGADE